MFSNFQEWFLSSRTRHFSSEISVCHLTLRLNLTLLGLLLCTKKPVLFTVLFLSTFNCTRNILAHFQTCLLELFFSRLGRSKFSFSSMFQQIIKDKKLV